MNKKSIIVFLVSIFVVNTCLIFCADNNTPRHKIGLLIVATGKYIQFVAPLIDSAQKYFCTNHDVTYFVFTDQDLQQRANIIKINQKRLGWPYDTMMRCAMYYEHKELFKDMDYLFAIDADMRFVGRFGNEVLSERVATIHPGYYQGGGTYETRIISRAYVAPNEGKHYFAGGVYGGKREEFLKMTKTMVDNIRADQGKGIIAVWHDESHLNRYFIDNPPTVMLSPAYCYPESWHLPFEKKLLALDKNHGSMRE